MRTRPEWPRAACRVLTAYLALVAVSGFAHHGPYGEYSLDDRVDFTGTVEAVKWSNPHALVLVRADIAGTEATWTIELGDLRVLAKKGWHGDELKPGTAVRIVNAAVNIAGNPERICCARIYDLDGREYFVDLRTN